MSPAFVSWKPLRNHINNPLKITSNQDIISHLGKKENPLQKYQTGIWMHMGDIGRRHKVSVSQGPAPGWSLRIYPVTRLGWFLSEFVLALLVSLGNRGWLAFVSHPFFSYVLHVSSSESLLRSSPWRLAPSWDCHGIKLLWDVQYQHLSAKINLELFTFKIQKACNKKFDHLKKAFVKESTVFSVLGPLTTSISVKSCGISLAG